MKSEKNTPIGDVETFWQRAALVALQALVANPAISREYSPTELARRAAEMATELDARRGAK